MTDKRPSDRAIAQAFWEWRTRSNYFRAKYSASIWVEERAAELDSTAAPVVVGEDVVERAIAAIPWGNIACNVGDIVRLGVCSDDDLRTVIRTALTAALAGD